MRNPVARALPRRAQAARSADPERSDSAPLTTCAAIGLFLWQRQSCRLDKTGETTRVILNRARHVSFG